MAAASADCATAKLLGAPTTDADAVLPAVRPSAAHAASSSQKKRERPMTARYCRVCRRLRVYFLVWSYRGELDPRHPRVEPLVPRRPDVGLDATTSPLLAAAVIAATSVTPLSPTTTASAPPTPT